MSKVLINIQAKLNKLIEGFYYSCLDMMAKDRSFDDKKEYA